MKFTIFLSTDGKHTVQAETAQDEIIDPQEMLTNTESMYDKIVAKYGTKQAQTVKAYTPKPAFPDDTGPSAVPPQQVKGYGVCPKCGAPNALSARGKIYCSKKCWL